MKETKIRCLNCGHPNILSTEKCKVCRTPRAVPIIKDLGTHVEVQWVPANDGRVAQLDVQRSSKPKVEGSNPSTPANKFKDLIIDD